MKTLSNIYTVGKRKLVRGFYFYNKCPFGEETWGSEHSALFYYDGKSLFWINKDGEEEEEGDPREDEEFELIRGLA